MVETTAIVKPPRAFFVAHPFGLTFGVVGDAATQRAVVDAMLDAAATMVAVGIRDSGFAWTRDGLRRDQPRKRRR